MRAGAESVLSCFHAAKTLSKRPFFGELKENFSIDRKSQRATSAVKNEYSKQAFRDFSNWLLLGVTSLRQIGGSH